MMGLGANRLLLPPERGSDQRTDVDLTILQTAPKSSAGAIGFSGREVITEPQYEGCQCFACHVESGADEHRSAGSQGAGHRSRLDTGRRRRVLGNGFGQGQSATDEAPLDSHGRFEFGAEREDGFPIVAQLPRASSVPVTYVL